MLPRLYPILDIDLCRERRLEPLAVLAAFLAGGARFLQLRDKTAATGAALALADAVVARAHAAGARVIVNDRADICRLSGADGVHVGQDDLTVDDARRIVGADAIVGLSTHDEAQIEAAARTSATYIAVGPIYGTATKDTGYSARGLDLVRRAARHRTSGRRHWRHHAGTGAGGAGRGRGVGGGDLGSAAAGSGGDGPSVPRRIMQRLFESGTSRLRGMSG